MSDSLVIFSLGPVQSFIAEARRAQDLWAGSKLLSDVTRAAIESFQKKGGTSIYPINLTQEGLPNKFVVRLKEGIDIQQAVKDAIAAAHQVLDDYAKRAKDALHRTNVATDPIWNGIWDRQLARHLEFFWAIVPLPSDDKYQDAYRQATRGFDACKRTRAFEQSEEDGLKDSLGGRRSALCTKAQDANEYWGAVAKKVFAADLKSGERLDSLGAIKRFGFDKKFPSVSTIAAADWFNARVGENAFKNARDEYSGILAKVGRIFQPKFGVVAPWLYDGDLFFTETLRPERLESDYGFEDDDLKKYAAELDAARTALSKLHKTAESSPSKYYAILTLDGDKMGEHVDACKLQSEHQDLSKTLSEFAKLVPDICRKHHGEAVYAGGDDVLALLPLSTALAAADELAKTYCTLFADWHQVDREDKPLRFTVSAGIAIAHHQSPLDATLRAVRAAESTAKRKYGRDALCVTVLKRSGERVDIGTKWQVTDSRRAVTIWEEVCQHFSGDPSPLSSKFAYDILNEARTVTALDASAQAATLKRLVKRHKSNKLTDQQGEDLKNLPQWTETLKSCVPLEQDVPQGFAELGRWLVLARFVAQGGGE